MKYYGLGRRKSAVAQVFIFEKSKKNSDSLINQIVLKNDVIVNQKKFFDYFQNDRNTIQNIQQLLKIFDKPSKIMITVSGGGLTGQKEAICLALAKALIQIKFYPVLKKQNRLTQDARVKERKKYGLKKARKAPQYSKR